MPQHTFVLVAPALFALNASSVDGVVWVGRLPPRLKILPHVLDPEDDTPVHGHNNLLVALSPVTFPAPRSLYETMLIARRWSDRLRSEVGLNAECTATTALIVLVRTDSVDIRLINWLAIQVMSLPA